MAGTFGFVGGGNLGKIGNSQLIEENIRYWIDVSLLENGGYDTISINETNFDGNDLSRLVPKEDRIYDDGCVYQSRFKNWVHETGISLQGNFGAPVVCSGIYVGSDFHVRGASGDMSYHVDFNNGRIIFDTADAPDTLYGSGDVPIYASFSYKRASVITTSTLWQYAAINQDSSNPAGSGLNFLNDTNIQLPAISINESRHTWKPYQLGGSKKCIHTISVYIFGNDIDETHKLVDMFSQQQNKKLPSIDWNTCETPLDEYGDINPAFSGVYGALAAYPWKDTYLLNAEGVKKKGRVIKGYNVFIVESSPYL